MSDIAFYLPDMATYTHDIACYLLDKHKKTAAPPKIFDWQTLTCMLSALDKSNRGQIVGELKVPVCGYIGLYE